MFSTLTTVGFKIDTFNNFRCYGNKLRGLIPWANYTDRATLLVGEVTVNFMWIEGVA
jgi:hypothetical protein